MNSLGRSLIKAAVFQRCFRGLTRGPTLARGTGSHSRKNQHMVSKLALISAGSNPSVKGTSRKRAAPYVERYAAL